MTDIYSKTAQCLIWMGELEPNIEVSDAAGAFRILESMATYEDLPCQLETSEHAKRSMEALATILPGRYAWWDRMWTLQEAVLPKKAVLLWGSLSID